MLRNETTGGFLMLLAAAAALLWANVGSDSYSTVITTTVGPESLHLDLDLATWAADGLLAVFFLVAGLELKREIVVGSLRRPSEAIMPIVAAVCGMVGPILVYVVINAIGDGTMQGWAVPTATDIAFALAVLAVIGSRLPTALRAFLLTLAVVDDLLAIMIIAVFFTTGLEIWPLLAAAAILAVYYVLQRLNVSAWWLYVPMGLLCWVLMHESGVHATVVGVAFGLLTRAHHHEGEHEAPAERVEHRVRPYSAVICVPIFALFAAGVTISGEALVDVFTEPVALGVTLGLVLGKAFGIFGGTALMARFTRAELNPDLSWSDVFGLSAIAGIGFTVSLLIGELAFHDDPATAELVKTAVLVGSVLAALLAVVVLGRRNATYRRISEEEKRDVDQDGIPDIYQTDEP
ncbi:sodium/proton antiporter (NhaA family) [Haloactinopolyspora alba]|uniref:Na(+)/H(+) antiporter NhaA n=1 Tax=Haloactinopolyspora alba TaxID=648780 RepID=A0A2P8E7E9_9ACTN|nr:Na+/H+ antiporter NhaA [Haloactinopolyspora alba]PSL05377.1 sodium/proton antiporter (NhaA family) [Haloactinopolyspora alba]